jgi:hypothetical protein
MAIWRGAGGPGDATTDAANEASVASTKAAEAAASASAAAGSATAASGSATSAASSASAAATSASNASSSASSASSSASSASTSASNASSSASSASSSASSASSSASAAASSASAASSSASAAATAQTNAETAETNAETAQTAAEAARDAALAALDNFDDRYLGEKSSDPTLDNDGDALVAGALYFNTTSNIMKVYTGSAWVAAYVSGSLTLNDLTDVVLTSATTGELLKYNGTNWVNGTVVTDLVGDTTPQLGGALDTNGYAINFGDNDKATFGDSEDLWLYHDGGTSYLFDRGTGNLRIITNSTVSIDGASGGEFMAQFVSNGAVSLYYDNSNKFQTTSTGINVNGNIAVSGTVDGRDVATDGTKLDGIEASADVTDATNVAAAGAVMDTDFSTNGLMKRTGVGTYTIVTDNSTNWDTAYGWGDHASAGYLTSYIETDPVYTASSWYTTTNNSTNWNTAYGWGDHSTAGYLTDITGESIKDLSDVYSTMSPTDGQLLTWDNANSRWDSADAPVSLPSQTGHAGEYLTTDGSTASWAAVSSNTTANGLYEHANTISSNYTITTGNNALSAGTMTINSGVTVTVPTGSTWTIV